MDRRNIMDADDDLTTVGSPNVYYTSPVSGEVQTLTVDATGGTFTLTFEGATTTGIAEAATNTTVQAALVALANLDAGDVTVAGSAGGPWTITFGGNYANVDVPPITTNAASLTGGAQTATISITTAGWYVNVFPANTTDTIAVRYWFAPPSLTNAIDTPIIPPRYHDLIVDGAAAYAYLDTDNFEGYANYKGLFEEGKERMRQTYLVQQHDQPDDFIHVVAGSEDW
jgi:hypothetical protein